MSVAKLPSRGDLQDRMVADIFIACLQEETPKWRTPWVNGKGITPFGQYNPVSGTDYRGRNQGALTFTALARGYHGDRWATVPQGNSVGAKVRKGEKGTPICHVHTRTDEVENAKGEKEEVSYPNVKWFYVFHESQFDNFPKGPEQEEGWRTPEIVNKAAQDVLTNSKAVILHDAVGAAFYNPSTDQIHLPPKEHFRDEAAFISTACHELAHWTGHKSRLDRDIEKSLTDNSLRAREELVAEISSMMMAARLGIQTDLGQHKSYVKDWVSILKDKPSEILKACASADKVCDKLGIRAPQHELLPQKVQTEEQKAHIEEGVAKIKQVETQSLTAAQKARQVIDNLDNPFEPEQDARARVHAQAR